jgi:putative endonuclease
MKNTTHTWDIWELIAIKYLNKKWYKVLDTNFKFWRAWEVDLIVEKDWITIFIEVKYRNNLKFGLPEEAITSYKLAKCKKTIDFYCVKNNIDFEKIRFDVITILKKEKSYKITHYKNVEI